MTEPMLYIGVLKGKIYLSPFSMVDNLVEWQMQRVFYRPSEVPGVKPSPARIAIGGLMQVLVAAGVQFKCETIR